MSSPLSRPVLASLMTCCLLLGAAGCQTAGREVAPGISRGAANTFTTLASDVETVTAATESAMRRRGLTGIQVVASEKRGEITGTWLDHTVNATVHQAGTQTAKVVVPHSAGSLLAQKLVQDVDALVYGRTPEALPTIQSAAPAAATPRAPVGSEAAGSTSDAAPTARRENPLAK